MYDVLLLLEYINDVTVFVKIHVKLSPANIKKTGQKLVTAHMQIDHGTKLETDAKIRVHM